MVISKEIWYISEESGLLSFDMADIQNGSARMIVGSLMQECVNRRWLLDKDRIIDV